MNDMANVSSKAGNALLGLAKAAETGAAAIIGGVQLVWRAFTSVVKFGILLTLAIMALRLIVWTMA